MYKNKFNVWILFNVLEISWQITNIGYGWKVMVNID